MNSLMFEYIIYLYTKVNICVYWWIPSYTQTIQNIPMDAEGFVFHNEYIYNDNYITCVKEKKNKKEDSYFTWQTFDQIILCHLR